MSLELRISCLGGEQCCVAAERHWTLDDVKSAIERAIGVPAREQRILAGAGELKYAMELGAQVPFDASEQIHLTLIRRSAEEMERLAALPPPTRISEAAPVFPPFPVLGLASDGSRVLLTGGGGGASCAQEMPNLVHAYLYDECTGNLHTIASLNTTRSIVHHLAFLPSSGLWLASCQASSKLLELSEEQNLLSELCEWATEQAGRDPIQNVARGSSSGDLISTGGTDGIVRIWDVVEPREPPRLKCACVQYGEIIDLDFSPDGQNIASCDRSGACRLWDTVIGSESAVIWYEVDQVDVRLSAHRVRYTVDTSNPSLVIAAAARQGPSFVGLFSASGEKLKEVFVGKARLTSFDVDMSGKWAGIGLVTGDKLVCELPSLRRMKRVAQAHDLPASCLTFLGDVAITGSGDRSMHFLDLRPKSRARRFMTWRAQAILILLFIIISWMLRPRRDTP